ncbi:MAG: hypothetical protein U5O39_19025 [Gammaproteobacteria bacterium]|nr:hypothetical protein [Gammaproteobacteria bacterium]
MDHISDLTIANSAGVAFQNTIGQTAPGSVTISGTSAGQSILFQGTTHLTGLTTSAQNYRVSLTGTGNVIDTAVNFTNTGGLVLGNSVASSTLFDGGVTTPANAAVDLAGTVSTSGDANIRRQCRDGG